MKLLYKPVAIICGVIAGMLSKRVFAMLWGLVDEREPPTPSNREAPLSRVVLAAVMEGATQRGTRAAVDRAGARTFHHLIGVWPGPREPAPER
ncbi:MAG TPA: DUF4235 domain-containing protein [Solirubrobacteraceae bacterium]|jgi:hypothetical protein|nr:DUF4235 domain-containing protein [Solirubrobacteraceae bacterium]